MSKNNSSERRERWEFQQMIEDLRGKLKEANRLLGGRGEEIHRLRTKIAELFVLHSKYERGEWRRLERDVVAQAEEIDSLKAENQELREKLAASEHVEGDDE